MNKTNKVNTKNGASLALFPRESMLRQRRQAQGFVLASQVGTHDKFPVTDENMDDNDKPLSQDDTIGDQKAADRHSFFIFLAIVISLRSSQLMVRWAYHWHILRNHIH